MELRVARSAEVLARSPHVLTDVERKRAAAFHAAADADDFVAAHLLVRDCVSALTGAGYVVIEQHCSTCGGDHGEPVVTSDPELFVSWSHSRGWVAAAAARQPVGVDLEVRGRRHDVDLLVRRTATPAEATAITASEDPEAAYLRMWCCKEALVKVGALTLAGFGRTDVSTGHRAGFTLTATVTDDYVVGVATQA